MPNSVAFLPFVGTVFNHISRVLARHNIKYLALPYIKLTSLLHPVKDYLGLKKPGVYEIPCQCGRIYIEQIGRSVDVRLKEQQCHIQLEYPDKSAIAEHSINQGHILFHDVSILNTRARYMDRTVREAFEAVLHPFNMKKKRWFLPQYIVEIDYLLPKTSGM
jgi:hypothetical protein